MYCLNYVRCGFSSMDRKYLFSLGGFYDKRSGFSYIFLSLSSSMLEARGKRTLATFFRFLFLRISTNFFLLGAGFVF